jgi:hypothetical protein
MTLQEAIQKLKAIEVQLSDSAYKETLSTVISAYEITDKQIIETAVSKYDITKGMSQTNCNKAIKSRHYFIQGAKSFRDGKIKQP